MKDRGAVCDRFKYLCFRSGQENLPFHTAKKRQQMLAARIIDLARNLGLRAIAEGVETASQLAFLRLQGCDEVQGYYFSKPLPSVQFEAFVRKQIGK